MDDDPQIRNLAVNALTYCVNRKVTGVENGRKAWLYLEGGGEVDIIISDVDMPIMNGLELMSRVKQERPETIFIIMSGVAAYEHQARQKGADAFLGKPFEINDLFDIVQCYIVAEET